MKWVGPMVLLFLVGCGGKTSQPEPVVHHAPDWVELSGHRMSAEVRFTPDERAQGAFDPGLKNRPRLIVFDYPQVRQLTLPATGERFDVAFFNIGGQATVVYPQAWCSVSKPCSPLTTPFVATSVLIAPPGTLQGVGFKKFGYMLWGKPAWEYDRRTRTYPLQEGAAVEVQALD